VISSIAGCLARMVALFRSPTGMVKTIRSGEEAHKRDGPDLMEVGAIPHSQAVSGGRRVRQAPPTDTA
jgi:hypothetical protein